MDDFVLLDREESFITQTANKYTDEKSVNIESNTQTANKYTDEKSVNIENNTDEKSVNIEDNTQTMKLVKTREVLYNNLIKELKGKFTSNEKILKPVVNNTSDNTKPECKKIYSNNGNLLYEAWYLDDMYHRLDGPALTVYSGDRIHSETWYIKDTVHRLNGPAMIRYGIDNNIELEKWFNRGKWIKEKQYDRKNNMVIFRYHTTVFTDEAINKIDEQTTTQTTTQTKTDTKTKIDTKTDTKSQTTTDIDAKTQTKTQTTTDIDTKTTTKVRDKLRLHKISQYINCIDIWNLSYDKSLIFNKFTELTNWKTVSSMLNINDIKGLHEQLENDIDSFDWIAINKNPNAINILKRYPQKINLYALSLNTNYAEMIPLLREHLEKELHVGLEKIHNNHHVGKSPLTQINWSMLIKVSIDKEIVMDFITDYPNQINTQILTLLFGNHSFGYYNKSQFEDKFKSALCKKINNLMQE